MRQAFNGRHSAMWARPEYTRSSIRVRTTYGMAWLWFTRLASADQYHHEYFCTQSDTLVRCTRSQGVRITTRYTRGR